MYKKLLTFLTLSASICAFAQTIKIESGHNHSLSLCADGTVNSWGENGRGQLGTGDFYGKKLPQSVNGLTNIISISAGGEHSLFLKSDGTVWASGRNSEGQLGDGTNVEKYVPVKVTGLTGITAISAGDDHSLFLKNNGTVWVCGDNQFGQLGDGTNVNKNIPVQVTALTGITAIASGDYHSLFLKNDGTVWACGINYLGQLGIGATLSENIPVQVIGLTGITKISAGNDHSLFLKNDNTVWACGSNDRGQLGDGTTSNKAIPLKINGLIGITSISGGVGNSLFLKNDGTVWGCGNREYGVLGNGTPSNTSIPNQIMGLTNITAISSGGSPKYPEFYGFSLFLRSDGTVLACGYNHYGLLGDGTTTNSFTPIPINPCVPIPQPPTVDFSNFPTSLCLGGNVNVEPTVGGSNPKLSFTVDSSIVLNAPKTIVKNNLYVYVLEGNSAIKRFGFNGALQATYNSGGAIANIKTIAAGVNDTVFANNGDGNIYKVWQGGSSAIPTNFAGFSPPKAMVNIPNPIFPENLLVNDSIQSNPYIINTNSTNTLLNTQPFSTDGFNNGIITSISYDNNEHANKRLLLADPANNKIWARNFDGPNLGNDLKLLVDSNATQGKAYDYIYADTTFNVITVSSTTSKALGFVTSQKNPDGSATANVDEFIGFLLKPQMPVGMIAVKPNGNLFQIWVADKGKNKLFRTTMYLYQITPDLPDGLKFNQITGKIEGSPVGASAPQTYEVIVSNQFGADTSLFTFGVTAAGPLSNNAGTSSTTGVQNDGLTIKYYEPNNCSPLLSIADSIGGTFPGRTQISQTVYPLVSVIATDSLVRRVNSIKADNQDSIKANIQLFYSYSDIKLFNQSRGSNLLSNDTSAISNPSRTMNMAVLQMHDKPDGSKEPIIHSPVAAKWSAKDQIWAATVPVKKFSEFYGSDVGTLNMFDCKSTGTENINTNKSYYVWNNDSIFASGVYKDTLINVTGCDSVATLNLTLQPSGVSQLAKDAGVAVYPNPNNGVFNIQFASSKMEPTAVRVTNILGVVIYNHSVTGSTQINLSEFKNGIYFVTIETNEKLLIYRIIKE